MSGGVGGEGQDILFSPIPIGAPGRAHLLEGESPLQAG